jgi:ubiquinone/menaquinone biosynthesis C-methylase UbiE
MDMEMNHEHERRFHSGPDRLRSPERMVLMEVPRVVSLCVKGKGVRNALDVGTGTGIFAEAFAAIGIEVTGIDVNTAFLALASKLAPSCRFLEGSAERIPFPDFSFDLVFLGMVLHETDDALTSLREARRVTRDRAAILEWPYRSESSGPPMEHRMRPEFIAELASRAGFSKIEIAHLERLDLFRLAI